MCGICVLSASMVDPRLARLVSWRASCENNRSCVKGRRMSIVYYNCTMCGKIEAVAT